jgi:hypothetical protein
VYGSFDGTQPSDLLATAGGVAAGAGWHTLSIPGSVPVQAQQDFFVSVKIADKAYAHSYDRWGQASGRSYASGDGVTFSNSISTDPAGGDLNIRGRILRNGPVPVELSTFDATAQADKVYLNWRTESETNNLGFEVERRNLSNTWEGIGFVPGNGSTATPHEYNFTDEHVPIGNYVYRLKQLDTDGAFEYSQEIEATIAAPRRFSVSQNYPNPFNASTTFKLENPIHTHVRLEIIDMLGRTVATLMNEEQEAGYHEVHWEANDTASGVYFYRLKAGSFSETKKLILLR